MRRALAALLLSTLAAAAPALAQQPVNPIHPSFAPLDAAGKKVRTAAAMSSDATCGACHDASWIGAHTGHAAAKVKTACIQCHADGGALDVREATLDAEGRLKREALRLGKPRAANCAACHGLAFDATTPVALPADIESADPGRGAVYRMTMGEGAIVAPQKMSEAFLNLEGKAGLGSPWDVHAAKLVDCAGCHYAPNDPGRSVERKKSLVYLTTDPRRPSSAEFLLRPDHRLAEPSCRDCHDALKAHDFLPYRERHMAVVACAACHLSSPMGPVAELVDATVATLQGRPAIRYRNVVRQPGEPLNAATVRPFRPLLVSRVEGDGTARLAPVNTVTRYAWVSGPNHLEVPWSKVLEVFIEGSDHAAAVKALFDANGDGRLDELELRLDSRAKTVLIADRLRAAGLIEPAIEGTLDTVPLAHGVPARDRALRACDECHAGDSRLSAPFTVAGYLPGGEPPRPADGKRLDLSGTLSQAPGGGLLLLREGGSAPGDLHVLGHSRQGLSNSLGFGLFVATFLGAAAHGLARWTLRRRRDAAEPHRRGEKAYLFGRYERIWHWTMALSGVLLIGSGLEIHNSGRHLLLDLPRAVSWHNVFAVVLMANAFLSLFYHLTTKAIRNFIPSPRGLAARVLEHMTYQSRGIFFGGEHPSNAPGHKLNPLQQLTYLALLNVLFPLQIVTGLLIWATGTWPAVAAAVGGLSVIAPLHNFGSWLFLTFFVLHAYLVTTGPTPTEHLTAMITGFGEVHAETSSSERSGT